MRVKKDPTKSVLAAAFFSAVLWTMAHNVHAAPKGEKLETAREHEIQPGETLGAIALMYGISAEDLMTANGIENPDKIFFGQKLTLPGSSKDGTLTKRGVEVKVPKGFTLNRIAASYQVSPDAIVKANRLDNPDRLREGQKLLIPGAKRIVELVPPPPCYKNAVTLYRVRTDQTLEMPLEFCNGKPNMPGLQQLSDLARSIARPTEVNLHPRLMVLLQKVADHYPGKRIEIISGQRAKVEKGTESYHNKGRAVDFRVEGVSNRALSQFVRSFENVGVGYYPNSVFIHMDTRERSAYWIDYSKPGEKAIYGRKGMSKDELEEIRAKRRAQKSSHTHTSLSAENDDEPGSEKNGDDPTS